MESEFVSVVRGIQEAIAAQALTHDERACAADTFAHSTQNGQSNSSDF